MPAGARTQRLPRRPRRRGRGARRPPGRGAPLPQPGSRRTRTAPLRGRSTARWRGARPGADADAIRWGRRRRRRARGAKPADLRVAAFRPVLQRFAVHRGEAVPVGDAAVTHQQMRGVTGRGESFARSPGHAGIAPRRRVRRFGQGITAVHSAAAAVVNMRRTPPGGAMGSGGGSDMARSRTARVRPRRGLRRTVPPPRCLPLGGERAGRPSCRPQAGPDTGLSGVITRSG